MNEEEAELLPPYLRPYPPSGAPLGTLSYNRRSKCWVVKGDPSVTEVCKRLFPGSAGSRRGEARFTAHRRAVGDLCWLMMRFPLEIKASDRALWEKAVTGAREYAVRQAKLSTMPVRMTPPDGAFLGTLRPFQEEGLAYLCSHDRCLLADEMGLGKTVQALAFLSSTGSLPALVIPPAHLTRNWQEETLRFLRVDGKAPRVHTIRGLKPYDLPEADVYIMHYLLLRGWKSVLPTLPFRSVIFDEIQELRHAGTEKYSAASLLSESCERVIGLSGTPIYNRGGEIWNVINILDYHFLGDWESFSREWCSGYGNQLVLKPDLLGAYLRREGLMLRRTKQEVLRELPPKRRLVQELDWNDKVYAQLMAPVMRDVLRWKQDDQLSAQERAMLEESISQHARQATGVAKAPYVCQFVRALLDGGEKVLLFAHHHQVMDIYKQELKAFSPGFITGRETTLAFLSSTGSLPALVIPPAHLTRNWQEETLRFLRVDGKAPRVHTIRGLKPYDLPEADVYIMHYLLLRGWKSVLPTLPFRSVIFDEIQELRHAGTEKYSAASLLSESCERVIGLSGTPIYNRGGEIWNVINILDYHFLGDWESFSREWCSGYGNQLVLKPDLLGAYLRREGLMLRRTKQEVLRELPPKRRLVQELDWNDKVYAQLMAPVMRDVLRWKQDDQLSAQERAMLEESISQHARQATGVAKAPYVCQFVRALLDGGEKVLLFAHHHQVMDIYKQELKAFSPGFITGRETTLAKMNAVDRFQSGRTDVLCISLRAASGLNLQRATCVVFGELDWSPAVHSQAEDRAHRMGQEDSLLCYYLVAPQGSDAVMQEALGLKVSQFVGLMGDAPQSPEQAEQFANQARRHVERIVAQMGDNSGSPINA